MLEYDDESLFKEKETLGELMSNLLYYIQVIRIKTFEKLKSSDEFQIDTKLHAADILATLLIGDNCILEKVLFYINRHK